jgi:hypothetical protein
VIIYRTVFYGIAINVTAITYTLDGDKMTRRVAQKGRKALEEKLDKGRGIW